MLAAPAKESRDTVPFERAMFVFRHGVVVCAKDLQNPDRQRGQPSQVHAIMAKNALQPVGLPAYVVKINSGNHRGVDVLASRPAQRFGAQNVLLQMAELHTADL